VHDGLELLVTTLEVRETPVFLSRCRIPPIFVFGWLERNTKADPHPVRQSHPIGDWATAVVEMVNAFKIAATRLDAQCYWNQSWSTTESLYTELLV
jgi:hypothetical protein